MLPGLPGSMAYATAGDLVHSTALRKGRGGGVSGASVTEECTRARDVVHKV